MRNFDKIISELRRENEQHRSHIDELRKRVDELTRSNDELKHRLSYYENAHTPPSKSPQRKKSKENDDKPNRGGIRGHKGQTQIFNPEKTIHCKSTHCPKCKSTNIVQISTKKRNMVGIPPPQKYNVTEHILHRYACNSCEEKFENDGNLPPTGQFDGTVIRNVVSMFSKRMPYNTIRESLAEQYGLHISNTTVQSILQTGQILLEPFYEEIRHKINTSDIVGFDETSYSIEGTNGWVWTARTITEALYVIQYSRGAKVLKKYWSDFEGIVISDGWRPYSTTFSKNKRQRCTAHLQRESREVADKSEKSSAIVLHKEFSEILDNARTFSRLKHKKTRRIKYTNYLFEQITHIIKRYRRGDDIMKKFGKKLKNALDDLFTFVMYSGVPSTNNDTENSVRKCVMQRNVRGQIKSEGGMRMLAVFLTCFETWRIRNQNSLVEMAKYI